MRNIFLFGLAVLSLLILGCTIPEPYVKSNASSGYGNQTGQTTGQGAGQTGTNGSYTPPTQNIQYKTYESAKSFYIFTDPNEGAFSLEVPRGWAVTNGSGLIRPYIDAGVAFEARSPAGQGFFFQDPYGYIYATPNAVLEYAGFSEGSLYGSSGGISNPMMVRHYMQASEFASELLSKSGIEATNVNITERSDLIQAGSPLITQQSAAEMKLDYIKDGKNMKSVVVVRTALVELSGTGVWSVSVMEYYAPKELINETELMSLHMQKTFKVDEAWAAREQQEMAKRSQIISQSQNDIADTISSVFETRSSSMDRLNAQWDNYILGVEDVYDSETGTHYVVDQGSNYYWIDNHGTIYGTDVDENPLPNEDLHPLNCPNCG